jgi:SDR family mycofactocin-dependent oxidoreductase
MGKLDGKVAFVTGAARGQGRSHAVRLAEEGADIIAVDLCDQIETVMYEMPTEADLAGTVKLVEDTGRRIVAGRGDVRERDVLARILGQGLAEFGRLDIVVANAGIMPVMGEPSAADAAWYDAINVMLTGVFLTIEVCLPTLIDQHNGGSIVITSSTAGLKGLAPNPRVATAGLLGYIAAKHGVVGLMRAYANALAADGIRVNTVHPTGVNTPMVVNEHFMNWATEEPDIGASFQNALPVQLVEPLDVSNAIAWLCSDDARYVTGVTLPVDAGFLVR